MSDSKWRSAGLGGPLPLSTRRLLLPLAVLALLAALIASQSGPAQLAHATPSTPTATTIVVKPSTQIATGPTAWCFYNDNTDQCNPGPGVGEMVTGPTGQPVGNGSAAMTVPGDNTSREDILTGQFDGVALTSITTLSYSSYVHSTDSTVHGGNNVFLMFDTNFFGSSGAYAGRLVFLPNTADLADGAWHSWNALNSADGLWYTSHTITSTEPVTPTTCTAAAPCTWAQVTAAWPNATIGNPATPGGGHLLFRVGSPSTVGYTGNVDAFHIVTNALDETFDFDPDNFCTMTCYVDASAVGTGDGQQESPFSTISAAVNQVQSGGTVHVAAGTYNETVTIDKALTLSGAQAGIDARSRTGGESTLTSLNITTGDVTVDGLSFNGSGAQVDVTSSSTTLSGVMIQNNIFSGYSGVAIPTYNAGDILVQKNLFENPSSSGESIQIKASGSSTGGCNGSRVLNNAFVSATNNGGADVNLSCTDSASSDVTVSGNTSTGNSAGSSFTAFSGVVDGIQVTNNILQTSGSAVFFFGSVSGAANIEGNTISSNPSSAVSIHGGDITSDTPNSGTFTVTGNTFNDDNYGVFVASGALTGTLHANRNAITGSTTAGVDNETTGNVDATCNFWGSPLGPGLAAGFSPVTGNVDFDPWLKTSDLANDPCAGTAADLGSTSGAVLDGTTTDTVSNGGGFDATYSGSGTVYTQLATYTSDPATNTGNFFGTGSQFFDVFASVLSSDPSATLTVTFPGLTDGQVLRWWDGTSWHPIISNDGTTPVVASGGSATVIFGASSSPRLDQLDGTPISSGDPAAIAVQLVSGNSVASGQQVTVNVVGKATALQGVDFYVNYAPGSLKLGAADCSAAASLITLGTGLSPDTKIDYTSIPDSGYTGCDGFEYNDTLGTIRISYAQNLTFASGNDILLATITLTGQAANNLTSTSISASSPSGPMFSDNNLKPLTVTILPALQVGGGGAVLTGTVTLQGRTDYSGTIVTVTDGTLAGTYTYTTGSDGTFSIPVNATGVYAVSAVHDGYLRAGNASYTVVAGTTPLAAVQLLGGDLNGDGTIGFADLSILAGAWFHAGPWTVTAGTTPSIGPAQNATPDFNGDGSVNLLDLSAVAANWNKTIIAWP